MLSPFLHSIRRGYRQNSPPRRHHPQILSNTPETLETRTVPAVVGVFNPSSGILLIKGDGRDNTLTVSRDIAGTLLINSGAVQIKGGSATIASTNLIHIIGKGGADVITLDETAGALPQSKIQGGGGDDTLVAGSGSDELYGDKGNDIILGKGGFDLLNGGKGNDMLTGGAGDDQAFGEAGNDRFTWNPGEGSDKIEGQAGIDSLVFAGSAGSENMDISANGSRVRLTHDIGAITMDISGIDSLDLELLGGADNVTVGDLSATELGLIEIDLQGTTPGGDGQSDTITINGTAGSDQLTVAGDPGGIEINGLAAQIKLFNHEFANDRLFINGQTGADTIDAASLSANAIQLTINGGQDNDTLLGSQGADTIIGAQGDDTASMGAGDDLFVWNPGEGNDTIEGQGGADTLIFNASNGSELIDLSANGPRLRLVRNIGNIVMDVNDTELIDVNTLGGADVITVNDLNGTDVAEVNLDLAASGGGGDGQADTITVQGTNGDDVVLVTGGPAGVAVAGLSIAINIVGSEASSDLLRINTLAGADVVDASGLAVGGIQLVADGGINDDVLIGSDADDTLLGGDGDDVLIGGPGTDVLDGGIGDNVVIQ